MFDFSWGDCRGVREIAIKIFELNKFNNSLDIQSVGGYPPHDGNHGLISETRNLLYNLCGMNYNYVLITNGATHALNAYVSARGVPGRSFFTHKNYFRLYPVIAEINRMQHVKQDHLIEKPVFGDVVVIDSPCNPRGDLHALSGFDLDTVWDAAYFSPTYCAGSGNGGLSLKHIPQHEAVAGSFGKFSGLNGLRLGYLATNSLEVYEKAFKYVEGTLCGANSIAQNTMLHILKHNNLEVFYNISYNMIEQNKYELSRLRHIFSGQNLPSNGMFAWFEIDNKIKDLLSKSNVIVSDGISLGGHKDQIRISLGNSNAYTKEMVDSVLKTDSSKQ